ncbi:MAG: glycosyltransferase [Saprospiraceae bacterium]
MKKIVFLGPVHPFRGGIASFSERLAQEFITLGNKVELHTFTLQYPSILFPGKTQFTNSKAPENLTIKRTYSSINPISWYTAGKAIKKLKPDLVICRFWLPFMAPCFGTIIKIIKTNKHTKVLAIVDNIVPHEKRIGDKTLAQFFCNQVDAFVAMSKSVVDSLKGFVTTQPIKYIPHPIYDNYGNPLVKNEARKWLNISPSEKIILFFGFIRDYKGLDLLIKAMADERIKAAGIRLVIAGEYYANQAAYEQLIEELEVRDQLILKTDFIPDEEVKYYFSAADLVVQTYKTATQSGISQLCYHFEKPMVVTNVGGLPEIVQHGKAGYVVEVDPKSIADGILQFYNENREAEFAEAVAIRKKEFGWHTMTDGIEELIATKV